MGNNSLEHYGVKGMKWGVRHDIKLRAINGARAGNFAKDYTKHRMKLENKIKKAESRGVSINKLAKLAN